MTVEKALAIIEKQEDKFLALSKTHKEVEFAKECEFAIQILKGNQYTLDVAMRNPDSLKYAIANCAAIGLTLNPVSKRAYLVPRDGKIIFDTSYMGMIYLASKVGSIVCAKADIVYENDTFKSRGVFEEPEHLYDAFSDNRGKIKGAYCTAKLPSGEYLTTIMGITSIYKIRDSKSQAWVKKKAGPWKTDETEMIKKTVIKRAAKTWPAGSEAQDRLNLAIDVDNEDMVVDGILTVEQMEKIIELLPKTGRTEEDLIKYMAQKSKRDIKTLGELTETEAEHVLSFLPQHIK